MSKFHEKVLEVYFIRALVSYSLGKNNYVYIKHCSHTNSKYSLQQKNRILSFFHNHKDF